MTQMNQSPVNDIGNRCLICTGDEGSVSGSRGERGCLVSSFSMSLLSAGVSGEKKRGSVETGK